MPVIKCCETVGGSLQQPHLKLAGLALMAMLLVANGHAAAEQCPEAGHFLQILGSGGPELNSERASSSYLLWRNGKALLVVDAGGGSAQRFAASGASMASPAAIVLSHLHADHSAALPALIKASYFVSRNSGLMIFGPGGNERFPSTSAFVNALFASDSEVYPYLGDHLDESSGSYQIRVRDFGVSQAGQVVELADGLSVKAAPQPHGPVPALAWRVTLADTDIVFSGDTSGDIENLGKFARDADILVAHHAIPEHAGGVARQLHMPPSVIAQIAARAKVKQLVLSHRMSRTLGEEAASSAIIRRHYQGAITFANDLDCIALQ